MGGFQYLDILFLAAIAGFIAFRLWSVLGQRTGEEQPRDPFPRQQPPAAEAKPDDGRVIPLPTRNPPPEREVAEPQGPNLTEIRLADRGFEPDGFIAGARFAYEMIVGAFAQGDEATLAPLVAPDVLAGFTGVIARRQAAGEVASYQLVSIKSATIDEGRMNGRTAEVTVRFVAEAISVVRDAEGRVIEGHPTMAREMVDVWTFARDTRSRDPNWQLVATGAR
ncbi:Tim44/TimA family putative adaptor protein [Zavarzinia compransoris]|uniref:Translocase n=1 Tax=Zavarzinia compransoris TaxID=1264899 RepID=A0A317E338_9PROT|nr:Tim44/TimA family putative adaptor protein [Zavarzinia compransoris]PWR20556.1 translocase [Zavarzinia compransoris]TDP43798.1 putative lipid-binding transport protein (Tim44 family) [Zavarzinia compransoris]